MAATGTPARCRLRSGDRLRDHRPRQLAVRPDHPRRAVGVHVVQGLRRDLPGQHRDPRQDPRHAPLPVADGVELPDRARQRLPLDGELGQPLGHEPDRAGRLGQATSRASPSSTAATRSRPSTSTGWVAPGPSTTRTSGSPGRWPSSCSAPGSTSPSSGPPRTAPAIPPAVPATSTSSRCSPCRTSRRSTAWACARSSPSAPTASTRWPTSTPSSAVTTRSSTTASCSRRSSTTAAWI